MLAFELLSRYYQQSMLHSYRLHTQSVGGRKDINYKQQLQINNKNSNHICHIPEIHLRK